jgi:hypothetical protein
MARTPQMLQCREAYAASAQKESIMRKTKDGPLARTVFQKSNPQGGKGDFA